MAENENFAVSEDKFVGYGFRVLDQVRSLWRAVLKIVIIFWFYERWEISWPLERIVVPQEVCSQYNATLNSTRSSVIFYTDKVKYFKS